MKDIDTLRSTEFLEVEGMVDHASGTYCGRVSWPDFKGTVIFGYSEGGLMEHVSISAYNRGRVPTWGQMERLKEMFFGKDEMAVQIHPAEDRYVHGVGRLRNVLHLWRPKDGDWSVLNHPERWD